MRILIIHNYYQKAGGEDIVFSQELGLLRENGHQVESLTFSNKTIDSTWKSILYFFKSIYNPASARVLRKRIKAFKPDLIHIHNTFLVASPSVYRTAAKMGIPVVQTLHNYRLICPSATLYYKGNIYTKSINKLFPFDAIFKGVYRNSIAHTFLVATISGIHKIFGTYKRSIAKFIVLSDFSKELFMKSSLHLDEAQVIVKPNFLNDSGRKASKKEDYFIYVGRLSEEKGIQTLLKAFTNSDKKLVIIGDGNLKEEVLAATKANKNISYKGFQEREVIMEEISKAKALIFPSEWYETFGLTIIEAFACSTPVIISDIGGHSEMVEEGKTGLHFTCRDADDLIRVIQKFEDLPEKEKMAENGRLEFEKKYTAQANYQFLINIYRGLFN